MVLIQKPIQHVYLWNNLVRPAPKTFTISRTEKEDMSSGRTYSDDAAWLTAGSGDFDDFFWYSAVLLNTSWVETAEMKQTQGTFTGTMSNLWNITSWDNVMIKFPRRWIKMTKSWSTITLSITQKPNASWYQYYAFTKGWTAKNQMYLWAYMWVYNGTDLHSRSWQPVKSDRYTTPRINYMDYSTAALAANRTWTWYLWESWYMRQYVIALYMMKYWSPYWADTVGTWRNGSGYWHTTWATDGISGATCATDKTSTSWVIRLFWLEDFWWNVDEFLTCCSRSSDKIYASPNNDGTYNLNFTITLSYNTITGLVWTNSWMFAPLTALSSSTGSGYYNYTNYFDWTIVTAVGPRWIFGLFWRTSNQYWWIRLAYL